MESNLDSLWIKQLTFFEIWHLYKHILKSFRIQLLIPWWYFTSCFWDYILVEGRSCPKFEGIFGIEPYVIFKKFWLLIDFLVEYMITLSASSMFELFLLMSSCLVEKERENWCGMMQEKFATNHRSDLIIHHGPVELCLERVTRHPAKTWTDIGQQTRKLVRGWLITSWIAWLSNNDGLPWAQAKIAL